MLINCPKCGFSQPKDQYCAKCGVDMQTFRPARPSIFKLVLGSPYLHVGLVFVLVAAAVLSIRQYLQDQRLAGGDLNRTAGIVLEKRSSESSIPSSSDESGSMEKREGTEVNDFTSQSSEQASLHSKDSLDNTRPESSPSTSDPALSSGEAAGAQLNSTAGATSTMTTVNEDAGARVNSGTMTIRFVELDRNTLKAWQSEMQSKGTITRLGENEFWGTISPAKLTELPPPSRVLETLKKPIDFSSTAYQFFKGIGKAEDSESEQGLSGLLTIQEWADAAIKVDLEIIRSFREDGGPVKRKSYSFNLELGKSGGAVIAGILPQRVTLSPQEEETADAFMQIFKSKNFQNSSSEFTLLITFDKPPSKSE